MDTAALAARAQRRAVNCLPSGSTEFTFVQLTTPEQMASAAELWARIWDYPQPSQPMAAGLLVALAHTGSPVTGVTAGGTLIAAASGFFHAPGPGPGSLHSHIAGVAVQWSGRGIGQALKWHQAAWCLSRGISHLTWTFDPLIARNAHFNLVSLGARITEYLPDHYGPMTDGRNAGQPSDRVMVDWDLAPARPTSWPPPGAGGALDPLRNVLPEPTWQWATVSVPPDIEALRRTDPADALRWRLALRDVFDHLDHQGWQIIGFDAVAGYHCLRRTHSAAA